MARIKIALSNYVTVDEWSDELSGITLKRSPRGEIVPVSVPDDVDFTNIRKAIRMNAILLLEGELPDQEPLPVGPTTPLQDMITEAIKAEEKPVKKEKAKK